MPMLTDLARQGHCRSRRRSLRDLEQATWRHATIAVAAPRDSNNNRGRSKTTARQGVLSAEKNRVLTQVGPGTPMGELLRRYWMPIGGASQLEQEPIKAIRLMGEDLVLYKDLGGRYGLLDRHCPHRRADLSYGFVEETGIRCNYHGWLMNETG